MKKIKIPLIILICSIIIIFTGFHLSKEPTFEQKQKWCVKNNGKLRKLIECDNSTSPVCSFPNKQTCYIDDLNKGKCPDIEFIHRITCD